MARMKFSLRRRPLHRVQRLRHRLQERERGAMGDQPSGASSPSMTGSRASARYPWPACTAPTRHARRSVPVNCFLHHCRRCGVALQGPLYRLRLLLLTPGPFGAPQYPKVGNFGSRGKMDKCTLLARADRRQTVRLRNFEKYGANRLAEGKLPLLRGDVFD